jgi:hypothetical protein
VVTTILLVRFRYHVTTTRRGGVHESLAEEVRLLAFRRLPERAEWLDDAEAEALLALRPTGNPGDSARLALSRVIERLPHLDGHLHQVAHERAAALRDAHRRVRSGPRTPTTVRPELPVDVLGVYVAVPPEPV